MRLLLQAMVFCLAGTVGAGAQDAEIKGAISQQLEAFRADDFATAFGFASPSLQNFFKTPENFGRMVIQGYPMVWRPAQVQYLDLRKEGETWLQKVRIADKEGAFHVLEYRMQRTNEGWRIDGVQILDAPDVAV